MSLNLRPSILDNLGILPALVRQIERYTHRTGIQVDFHHAELDRRFSPEIETVVYRVVQEALTNVARYAGVAYVQVQITIGDDPPCIVIEILDEGQGFDLPAALNAGTSSGVSGMYERVGLVGGDLFIETAPGQGTTIIAEIPLP
jgi:signal transduction histidine kinase